MKIVKVLLSLKSKFKFFGKNNNIETMKIVNFSFMNLNLISVKLNELFNKTNYFCIVIVQYFHKIDAFV